MKNLFPFKFLCLTFAMVCALFMAGQLSAAGTGPDGVMIDNLMRAGIRGTVFAYGDEHYARYVVQFGENRYDVVKNNAGEWCFATLSPDRTHWIAGETVENGNFPLIPSAGSDIDEATRAQIVNESFNRTTGQTDWYRRSLADQLAKQFKTGVPYDQRKAAFDRYNRLFGARGYAVSDNPANQAPVFTYQGRPDNPALLPVRGKVQGLTFLVAFQNENFFPQVPDLDSFFNGPSTIPSERIYNNAGSVRSYFLDHTQNTRNLALLDYEQAVIPVILKKPRQYYQNLPPGTAALELLKDALNDVDSDQLKNANLNALTTLPGTDMLRAVSIVYLNQTGTGGLWGHQANAQDSKIAVTADNVTRHVGDFIVGPLQLPNENGIDYHPAVGPIIHETAHLLAGFPDLYDYGAGIFNSDDHIQSAGVGNFCIMGSGAFLTNGLQPAPVNAMLRLENGWVRPTVCVPATAPINFAQFSANADLIPVVQKSSRPEEMFIFQNMYDEGTGVSRWNAAFNQGGLAVWHADTAPRLTTGNECQEGTNAEHYRLALIQMDNLNELENNVNGGHWADLMHDQIGWKVLSNVTEPALRWWNREQALMVITYERWNGGTLDFSITKSKSSQPPENVAASDERIDGIMVSWDAVAPNFLYRVTRYDLTSGTQGRKEVVSSLLNQTEFLDKSALPGRYYYYTVSAGENVVPPPWSLESDPRAQGLRRVQTPEGITVSNHYSDKITLKWNTVPFATAYNVYRAETPDETPKAVTYWISDTSYTDKDVEIGKIYYYYVSATCSTQRPPPAIAVSENSYPIQGKTVIAPPTNVSAAGETRWISVTWEGSKGANFYRVYRTTFSEIDTKVAISGWITDLFYQDQTAEYGKQYYYFIQASNNNLGSNISDFSLMSASAARKLAPPNSLTATQNNTAGVSLSWPAVTGAGAYKIFRSTNKTDPRPAEISGGWIPRTTFTDINALPGKDYYYFVRAAATVNGGGESDYFPLPSEGNNNFVLGVTKLSAPTGLTATRDHTSGITLTWKMSSGATVYRIFRSTSPTGGNAVEIQTVSGAATYTDETVPSAGVLYYYGLEAAVNSSSASGTPYRSEKSSFTGGIRKIPVITSLTATQNLHTEIKLTWRKPIEGQNNFQYDIYRASVTGNFEPVKRIQSGETLYADPVLSGGIQEGNYYRYYVVALIDQNYPSDPSAVITGAVTPSAPAEVYATDSLKRAIEVSWLPEANAAYYQVMRSNDSPMTRPEAVSPWLNATKYLDQSIQPSDTYYYAVHSAIDAKGVTAGPLSAPVFGHAVTEYKVTVTDGSGSDYYKPGERVTITANAAPSGYRFYRWESDSNYGTDTALPTLSFTMPVANVYLTAQFIKKQAVGILDFTQTNAIGVNESMEAILSFNRPLQHALTVPLILGDSALWTASDSSFRFKAGASSAVITLTAKAKIDLTALSIRADSSLDFSLPAQITFFTIRENGIAPRYTIEGAPESVMEGQLWAARIAGPQNNGILQFSISGLKASDYLVLDAAPRGGGVFEIRGEAVTRTGIRVQILSNKVRNDVRTLTLTLTGSIPANLVINGSGRSIRATVIDTPDIESRLAQMSFNSTDSLTTLLPNANALTAQVLGGYDPRNVMVSRQLGLILSPDSKAAPLGWMSVVGYKTDEGLEGQGRVYFGAPIGYKTSFTVNCADLGYRSLTAFNSRPSFKLAAFDPFKDPDGLKQPKRAPAIIDRDTWEVGVRQIKVDCRLNLRLYNVQKLRENRKAGRFFPELDSAAVVESIGTQLLMTYHDKEWDLKMKDVQVGAILLTAPSIISADTPKLGLGGRFYMNVKGVNFGSNPKVSIEYSNGRTVETVNVKCKAVTLPDGMSLLQLTLPKRPKRAIGERFYLLFDSGVGITALPFIYPKD